MTSGSSIVFSMVTNILSCRAVEAFDLPMPRNGSEGADSEGDCCYTSGSGKVGNLVKQPNVRVKARKAALVRTTLAAVVQVHPVRQGTWPLPSHPFFLSGSIYLKVNAKSPWNFMITYQVVYICTVTSGDVPEHWREIHRLSGRGRLVEYSQEIFPVCLLVGLRMMVWEREEGQKVEHMESRMTGGLGSALLELCGS